MPDSPPPPPPSPPPPPAPISTPAPELTPTPTPIPPPTPPAPAPAPLRGPPHLCITPTDQPHFPPTLLLTHELPVTHELPIYRTDPQSSSPSWTFAGSWRVTECRGIARWWVITLEPAEKEEEMADSLGFSTVLEPSTDDVLVATEGAEGSMYLPIEERERDDESDRWSVLSTGPVDRQWTVVFEEREEMV